MLFFTKSAFCIAAVAIAAGGGLDGTDFAAALGRAGRDTAVRLGQSCVASTDCSRIGLNLVGATTRSGTGDSTASRLQVEARRVSAGASSRSAPRRRPVSAVQRAAPVTLEGRA